MAVFLEGCAESSFAGLDQQACVERALRRTKDLEAIEDARATFGQACRQGGAEACSALGVMNEAGVGGPVNAPLAVGLYDRACSAGNVRGCTNLAIARIEGIGVRRDPEVGARMLVPTCAAGDARACLYLARLHNTGEGTSRDPALAARLLAAACEGDEALACMMRAESDANAGDYASASTFYGKACALGDPDACGQLALPEVSKAVLSSNSLP